MNLKKLTFFNLRRAACFVAIAGLIMAMGGCGGGSSSGPTPPPSNVNNQQPISVNAGPADNDVDMAFTSVTICVPGTSNCQTIPNVQIDTGSEGLRILASELSISLPGENDSSGNPLGNCIVFADNTYVWGPVATADIQMAGEKATSVPIQIIGSSSFPGAPSACSSGATPVETVPTLGANGLIGVGVFLQDCGAYCAAPVSQQTSGYVYFGCASSGCSPTSVPIANQLQNPVSVFPQDNNGLMIFLPSVPATGSATVSGTMYFGIGTQSDNALGSAQVYDTDDLGNFSTTFQGQTYSASFIDSGSNGLFFLTSSTMPSSLPACSGNDSGFSCPSSPVSFSATNTGTNGTAGQVSFSIGNAATLFDSGNTAFSNLGGPDMGDFDWGLAFFFGRHVFIGIEGQSSPGGAGPYWAY
jgi:hypothetical protein